MSASDQVHKCRECGDVIPPPDSLLNLVDVCPLCAPPKKCTREGCDNLGEGFLHLSVPAKGREIGDHTAALQTNILLCHSCCDAVLVGPILDIWANDFKQANAALSHLFPPTSLDFANTVIKLTPFNAPNNQVLLKAASGPCRRTPDTMFKDSPKGAKIERGPQRLSVLRPQWSFDSIPSRPGWYLVILTGPDVSEQNHLHANMALRYYQDRNWWSSSVPPTWVTPDRWHVTPATDVIAWLSNPDVR